jgi:hypothetical protein
MAEKIKLPSWAEKVFKKVESDLAALERKNDAKVKELQKNLTTHNFEKYESDVATLKREIEAKGKELQKDLATHEFENYLLMKVLAAEVDSDDEDGYNSKISRQKRYDKYESDLAADKKREIEAKEEELQKNLTTHFSGEVEDGSRNSGDSDSSRIFTRFKHFLTVLRLISD